MPHSTIGSQNGDLSSFDSSMLSQKVAMNNLESDSFIDYVKMKNNLDTVRKRLGRPLVYAEKVLFSHLDDPTQDLEREKSYLRLRPDRVASHDATAQTVFLQLMSAGLTETKIPMTVYSDHLITARVDGIEDLGAAWQENREVWDFLSSACAKFGVGLWKPGSGIFHQVLLENYAFPGGLVIGTDSHTPNAGGLAMCAIGVGGGDTVDVLAGVPWEVQQPKIFGVRLTGRLNGWAAPKGISVQKELSYLLTVSRHHSQARWLGDRQRRNGCHHGVLWSRSRDSIMHWHGNNLQHGSRNWCYDFNISIRRQHVRLPRGDEACRHC